ncbi:MAG: DMT family transporter, partial [Bacillota bacterium]
ALVLATFGAMMVIRPRFDSSIIPSLIALASAFFSGISYTVIRHLKKYDSPQVIVFYFLTFLAIVMLPVMLAGNFVVPTPKQWIALLMLGVFGTAGQLLMTNAYHFAPAGELSIYTYANIIFSTVIGLIVWTEIPDLLSVLGGALIIIAGIVNYNSKSNSKNLGVESS